MATVVYQRPRDLGGKIGEGLGAGLGQGLEDRRSQREAEARSRRFSALLDRVEQAPDRRSALEIGVSEFSDLFSTPEEFQQFGQMVDDIHKGEEFELAEATVDGENRNVVIPKSVMSDIGRSGDQDNALAEFLGVENASLGFSEPSDDDFVELFSLDTGLPEQRVSSEGFDPSTIPEGLSTKEGFANALNLRKESRASAEAAKGSDRKPTDAEQAVRGILASRNLEASQENIEKGFAIRDRSDKFAPRMAATFNIDLKSETPLQGFENRGMEERFALATTTMPNLMWAGLTAEQAFKAARTVAKSIPTRGVNLEGQPTTFPPEANPRAINPQNTDDRAFLQTLDPRKDKGKVFRIDENTLWVYIGEEDGEPAFELVER